MIRQSTSHFLTINKISNITGVEIGAASGLNAQELINNILFDKLYLVENGAWSLGCIDILKEKFLNKDNVELVFLSSVEAATLFNDEYFDYIYIDADHKYDSVKSDINAWYSKLKTRGWMYFHDYDAEVKKAVDEFFISGRGMHLERFMDQPQSECGVCKA